MKFGNHAPTEEKDRGSQSALAAFTRGLQVSGRQWKFDFDNGYGASVINDGYGAETGRYELAVLGLDGHLTYDTPVTDDVLGFLDEAEVAAALDQIAALTPKSIESVVVQKAAEARSLRIIELRAELAALEAEVSA